MTKVRRLTMVESHGAALLVAYATALASWWIVQHKLRRVWPQPAPNPEPHAWRSLGAMLLGVLGVIAIGHLHQRGYRVPASGRWQPLVGALNQLIIFAPVPIVALLRRESPRTLWLGRDHWLARLLVGAGCALLALTAYTLVRSGADSLPVVLGRIVRYERLDEAVQVFLEDLAIAALLVRLAAVMSTRGAIVLVAVLFAAGHIPAMLSNGASLRELIPLVRDAALATCVVGSLAKGRDFLWFWPVHFVMDMTQFDAVIFGT